MTLNRGKTGGIVQLCVIVYSVHTHSHMTASSLKKKRLVVELLPAHINQLKWVAMKRRVSVTQLVGELSCQLFYDEVPTHFDLRDAMRLITDADNFSEIPFD